MGVVLFLLLKAARVYDSSADWVILCLLLAIESPQWARLWVYWKAKR